MGKPKHGNDTRGDQKGAQQHDEGQYGPKALEAKRAEVADHAGARNESDRAASDPNRGGKAQGGEAKVHESLIAHPEFEPDGKHRLFENRKQHDDGERDSERNRLDRDIERHDHDPAKFQGHGTNGGGMADSGDGDVTIRNPGKGGGNHSGKGAGNH